MSAKRKRFRLMSQPLLKLLLLSAAAGLIILLPIGFSQKAQQKENESKVRLMTLDPGHFHAALIQKEMYPGVSKKVDVYAPLSVDLTAHLYRIAHYNQRSVDPTSWDLEIHTGPDYLARMLKERPGNVVVIAGRNSEKIDKIKASIEAGLDVLSDKPWIIESGDLPKLEVALNTAEAKGLVAHDVMTYRFEVTSILLRELVNDPSTFGRAVPGTLEEPSVKMDSLHHLMKIVSGVPNLRPAWFFDVKQQGEGMADIGTHLVDLTQWILFPKQSIDFRKDIEIISAKRWPTVLTGAEFKQVTGGADYLEYLAPYLKGEKLEYYCNTKVNYKIRGFHVRLQTRWNFLEPKGSGDVKLATFRGEKARVEMRPNQELNNRPELFVIPAGQTQRAEVIAGLKKKVAALQSTLPGLGFEIQGEEIRLNIPDQFRIGHEACFEKVTNQFLGYLGTPGSLPSWEKANMLAKYYVTTKAVELSRRTQFEKDNR